MVNEQTKLGSIIGGRFILERLAGSGGMGDVYQAKDSHTGTLVALKVLRGSADGFARRFQREARTLAQLAQLDHAGIVRYVASGSEPSIFLAMEWLDGEDLGRRLSRGPLRIGETVQIALRVADALSAAHARGIVHRDIKPSKISPSIAAQKLSAPRRWIFGVYGGGGSVVSWHQPGWFQHSPLTQ